MVCCGSLEMAFVSFPLQLVVGSFEQAEFVCLISGQDVVCKLTSFRTATATQDSSGALQAARVPALGWSPARKKQNACEMYAEKVIPRMLQKTREATSNN